MLLLILLIIFTVVFLTASYFADVYDNEVLTFICVLLGSMSFIGMLFCTAETASSKSNAIKFAENKAYHDDLLANIGEGASTVTITKIIKEVEKDNEKILEHRSLYENVFIGKMYRKEVAELELTPLPEIQIKKDNNALQQP